MPSLTSNDEHRPTARATQGVASPEFSSSIVGLLPQLRERARRLNSQSAEAKDLVQETCRRALEAYAQFAPGSDMRAWLLCILRNLSRDRARRAAHEVLVGDDVHVFVASTTDEPPPVWTRVSDEEVARAIASLPRLYSDVYALHVVEGLSYNAIADRLGVRRPTVGTRLRRARLHLRRLLAHDLAAAADDGRARTTRSRPLDRLPRDAGYRARASR